jgi:RecG-like helicase
LPNKVRETTYNRSIYYNLDSPRMEESIKMKNPELTHPKQTYNQYKETRYCILLNQAKYKVNEYSYCLEKIYVKEDRQQEEIRFALYKTSLDKKGQEITKLVPRPLDTTEEELLELLKEALSKEIFSKTFLKNLKHMLQENTNARTQKQSTTITEVHSNV